MSNLIKIGNQEIFTKEFKGQRVITFKDIDLVHERPEGTAKRNFSENREHLIENEDFFILKPADVEKYENRTLEIPNRGLTIFTEQGYLMLVKSFNDDLAWKVQRDLVNIYFKRTKVMSPIERLKLQGQALLEVDAKIDSVDKDLQEFKQDMPLLGVEESRVTSVVRRKGVQCLGGKDSVAYKDSSIRGKVYSDIYSQLKREFGVDSYKAIKRNQCDLAVNVVEAYDLPIVLENTINTVNSQMDFDDLLS